MSHSTVLGRGPAVAAGRSAPSVPIRPGPRVVLLTTGGRQHPERTQAALPKKPARSDGWIERTGTLTTSLARGP
jgi:hypothetical protein